jgi:hypothetical protein
VGRASCHNRGDPGRPLTRGHPARPHVGGCEAGQEKFLMRLCLLFLLTLELAAPGLAAASLFPG